MRSGKAFQTGIYCEYLFMKLIFLIVIMFNSVKLSLKYLKEEYLIMNNIFNAYNFKRVVFSPAVYLCLRLVLGGIFIYSGAVKLTGYGKFAGILYGYGILPDFLIYPTAVALPLVEIVAGSGLVFNIKYSLEVITLMLLLFIAVLWFGILTDLNIDCGCFSSDEIIEQRSLYKALYRDFIFIGVSIFIFISRRVNTTDKPVKR